MLADRLDESRGRGVQGFSTPHVRLDQITLNTYLIEQSSLELGAHGEALPLYRRS